MSNHRITDAQATALLGGRAPEGRDDLQDVAALVGALRLASFEPPPQPSPALAARLDLDRLAWVSAARGTGVPGGGAERTPVLAKRRAKSKMKTVLGWFTGLGIAAQLALGAGALSASAAGIGMAGALPAAAQEVFDTVVATVASADELRGGPGNARPEAPERDADARRGADGPGTDIPSYEDASGSTESGIGSGAAESKGADASAGAGGGKPDAAKPEKAQKPEKAEGSEHWEKTGKPEKADGGKPGKAGAGTATKSGDNSEKTGSTESGDAARNKPAKYGPARD